MKLHELESRIAAEVNPAEVRRLAIQIEALGSAIATLQLLAALKRSKQRFRTSF